MSDLILCGSSCVKYILRYYKKSFDDINLQMIWATELAICLKEKGFNNIEIMCYKSNLFFDYTRKKNIDLGFAGFKNIEKALNLNIPIIEKKFDERELFKEIEQSKFIILCVESAVFNDKNMRGGHFIILDGTINNEIKIINPIKEQYECKLKKPKDIIQCCKNYGSWRVLIKEDINDKSYSV